MASKPKGKKGRASYSDKSQASVGMTDVGPSNVKDATSQVATSGTQDPEWMTLRSGTRLERKETMETSLGLILEAMDMAIATSSEVETKKEDTNTSRDYMGPYGSKLEDKKGVYLSQIKEEVGEQAPTIDELRRRKIKMRMAIQEEDEMLMFVIRPLQRRLRDLGPDPGYTNERWMECLRTLGLPSVYKGEDTIQETLRRSEPLQSIDQTSWTIFINGIMGELNTVLREATMMPEERIKVNPTMGSTPSTPDTLKLAEQSLLLPKQEEESNSAVEQQMNTAMRMKNPPKTDNDTTSSSSRMTKEEVKEERKDRVVHQRIRNSGIKDNGESIIMEQGIVFDGKGKPRDIRPGQKLRREGIGTTGGRSHPERKPLIGKRPPKGGQRDDEESLYSSDEEDEGGSEPPTDVEEEVEGAEEIEGASKRPKVGQRPNSRNYNVPYQRSHTAELDVYRDRGGPRTTKYLRAIHNKFHRIIDDYVGVMVENPGGIKTPKVPDPRKYSGEIDTEVFNRWLVGLLRWFRVNRYCGMEYDRERVVCMAMYLEGTAATWYDDNVNGLDHQRDVWSFKLVITGLYDWFVHHASVGTAADKFWNATYVPEEGIMALYHELTRHAVRMV
jgi:hypothetical protein